MNLLVSWLALLSLLAAVVVANGNAEARCKCFTRGTGSTVSGDGRDVCGALKDTHFNNETQECVIPKSNWYGPGAFGSICLAHTGFTNCQMKDRQLIRRSLPELMFKRDQSKSQQQKSSNSSNSSNGDVKFRRANCQCLNTIIGKVAESETKETCEAIAGGEYDDAQQSCRINQYNDLQVDEFRRYCLIFVKGSSC